MLLGFYRLVKLILLSKKQVVNFINLKNKIMNIKRIFGALLTALGIGGLIYTVLHEPTNTAL
jgi:hypothetical protein